MTPSATSSSLNIFASITSLKNSRPFELLLPKPHKELPLQLTKHSNHKFSRSCCTSHTINSFYNFLTIQHVLRNSKNHALSCHHCTRQTKNYLRHHQKCVFENILAPLSIEPKNYNILAIVSLWNSLCDFTEPKSFPCRSEISQLKKEKAMALLEEACEEANDTLIRRFGGSGLTYVSVYFLNQQLISWLIFLVVKTRWSSFCKGWLVRKTGGEAIARLRPLGWSNIGCPEGKASRKTNRTNLASTFFNQIKGI